MLRVPIESISIIQSTRLVCCLLSSPDPPPTVVPCYVPLYINSESIKVFDLGTFALYMDFQDILQAGMFPSSLVC